MLDVVVKICVGGGFVIEDLLGIGLSMVGLVYVIGCFVYWFSFLIECNVDIGILLD